MKWQQKLTKKMHKHLKDTDAWTLADVKANIDFQNEMTFPCWECVEIARILDIPCSLTAFDARCVEERREERKENNG